MTTIINAKDVMQHTLKKSFVCIGKGLHTGLKVIMTVMPAEENSGYWFVRKDIAPDHNEILAVWHSVSDTHLCTTISNNFGIRVSTIEHLIAALRACGVDNARIVLDGPEVPILDGSSQPFVQLIQSVGVVAQAAERYCYVIKETTTVSEGNKIASLFPSPIPWVEMEIDFESRFIGKQNISIPMSEEIFDKHIAGARTFGFAEQIDTLKKLGFTRGGSLKNAVVVDKDGILNAEGLRYKNEFVRHKVLDSIGDLALAGAPILGRFSARYSGHKLNNQLLHALMLNKHAFSFMTVREARKYQCTTKQFTPTTKPKTKPAKQAVPPLQNVIPLHPSMEQFDS